MGADVVKAARAEKAAPALKAAVAEAADRARIKIAAAVSVKALRQTGRAFEGDRKRAHRPKDGFR